MAQIHQLSPTLSNQIAAGEVIERPASVVKELVENAIDAQASQIDIQVQEAGIKSIRVRDNGQGIAAEQVTLAFQAHTTSKITTSQDLFQVRTLGFRGEALASIAAVAQVTLTTSSDGAHGTQIKIAGGQQESLVDLAASQGTTVVVADLFYNTPARLKYLKTVNTELNRVIDIVNRLALAHPQIAFTLRTEKKDLLKTSGNGQLQQALAGIYGRKAAQQMVSFKQESADFQVWGYTSLPQETRANRKYISLLVNGRYIVNYQLVQALLAGYGTKLMVGRFPLAVVNIKLDPILVDVNVHPTKREVRFSKESLLAETLTAAIGQGLGQSNLLRSAKAVGFQAALAKSTATTIETKAPVQQQIAEPTSAKIPSSWELPGAVVLTPIFEDPNHLQSWDQRLQNERGIALQNKETQVQEATLEAFPQLQFVAQIHATYLLAESSDGFYLVDQHAAQERVNYEKIRPQLGNTSPDQQQLLVPLILDYANSETNLITEQLDNLQALGIGIAIFGQNSFVVTSYPTWIPEAQAENLIRNLIEMVLQQGSVSLAEFREQTARQMSCKLSIRAHDPLDRQQAQAVLDQLAQAHNPYNCPHGRPTLIHFSDHDLQKAFKRIQDPHQAQTRK
ncbi:DNA mismatch repair endonuclease MutL [Lactobacillus sp. DCY120]|uniref:DNA mismatch repair protein MutL n=1 Tax=Bombilactobacillus apium TaxID=2675299 RepID=A0A850QZ37_9LACO|nr:DNA mismatch repair endonuclease MutL [Bombilactobacillus apium]NVY97104.1 DNA mismatch repair endonuclease MutL [Bombilactobacillus apium]